VLERLAMAGLAAVLALLLLLLLDPLIGFELGTGAWLAALGAAAVGGALLGARPRRPPPGLGD